MRVIKLITAMAILSLAFSGLNCKKDEEPESAIPEKYIGTWVANLDVDGTLIEYAPASDPGNGVDVRFLGGAITVTLKKDGTYSLTTEFPGEDASTDQGSVTLDEDLKIIRMKSSDPEGDTIIFAYEWTDDNTLTLTTQAEFDFPLEGNPPVPAIVTIIIKRST